MKTTSKIDIIPAFIHSSFILFIFLLASRSFVAFPDSGLPEEKKKIAILTSGGDDDGTVNDWRKDNLDNVCAKLEKKGFKCNKAFDKKGVVDEIKKAVSELKCGDELVLYFNGHGGSGEKGFFFDREPDKIKGKNNVGNMWLPADTILKYLKDLECCVKVYVAVHSCFSGQFVEGLKSNEHIVVIVSSASSVTKAHKKVVSSKMFGDYVDKDNWPDGFSDGLDGDGSTAELFQKAAKSGKGSAEAGGYTDDPKDFKRGHVEKVEKYGSDKLKVTLKVGDGEVAIIVDKGKKINVTKDLSVNQLEYCFDIEASGNATFDTKTGNFVPSQINIKGFNGKFHVVDVSNLKNNMITVHFVKPDPFFCKVSQVRLDTIPVGIKFCQWYNFEAVTADGKIVIKKVSGATPEPYNFVGHIEEVVDKDKGIFIVDIQSPEHLKGKRKINLKEGEKLPEWFQVCLMVGFKGVLIDDEVRDATIVDVARETFRGHVLSVKDGIVEIDQIIDPPRYKGMTKKIIFVNLKDIKGFVSFCNWIQFSGKCYGEEIRDPSSVNKLSMQDAGAEHIIAPSGNRPLNESLNPAVVVINNSMIPHDFQVSCTITNIFNNVVYLNNAEVINLEPAVEKEVSFPSWVPVVSYNNYSVLFRTNLPKDENPANDTISARFNVIGLNQPPVISNPHVIPDTGNMGQPFNYSVTYTDADGDFPVLKEIVIDNNPHPLTMVNGNPTTGLFFQFQISLQSGWHTYRFKFDDGQGNFVETQVYQGPYVKN